MKYIILSLFISGMFLSCTGPCTHEQQGAKNIELIEAYIDAVEAGDLDAIDAMTAENYRGHGPYVADTINKKDGMESFKYNMENLYDKIEYSRSRNIAVTLTDGEYPGDWVSNWSVVKVTYQGSKKPVQVLANSLYKIDNGKITESFTIYNAHDALLQAEEQLFEEIFNKEN